MKRTLQIVFTFILIMSYAVTANSEMITCIFEKNFAINVNNGSLYMLDGAYKTKMLQIKDNKTTDKTLWLDGAIRATNSNTWFEVQKDDKNSLVLVGDDGDLLSINLSSKLSSGVYSATFAYTFKAESFVYTGACEL